MKTFLIVLLLSAPLLFATAQAEESRGKATFYTVASCIREGTSGVKTASGENYDESKMTCALPRKGYGGTYRVTNVDTGVSVLVRHNDFGPGKQARRRGVVIDLSPEAFKRLGGDQDKGFINVTWVRLEDGEKAEK